MTPAQGKRGIQWVVIVSVTLLMVLAAIASALH